MHCFDDFMARERFLCHWTFDLNPNKIYLVCIVESVIDDEPSLTNAMTGWWTRDKPFLQTMITDPIFLLRSIDNIWRWFELSAWWRHQMETYSALLAICAGNLPVTGEFPAQRPVTRSFDIFIELCLNKRLSLVIWDAIAPIMTSL